MVECSPYHSTVSHHEKTIHMTAEVAILNKTAVALAADSAATIEGRGGRQKIYNTVNKLFTLSKLQPVGIMVYGDSDFLGVPWESIIKIFRERLAKKRYPKLSEYGTALVRFINRNRTLFPEESQKRFVRQRIGGYLLQLTDEIDKRVKIAIDRKGIVEHKEVAAIVRGVIRTETRKFREIKPLNLGKRYRSTMARKYGGGIDQTMRDICQNLPGGRGRNQLYQIALDLFCRDVVYWPGFVVAGFGDRETFPSVFEYQIDGMLCNKLRYVINDEKSGTISFNRTAGVLTVAQQEEANTFVRGINDHYKNEIIGYVDDLLSTIYPKAITKSLSVITEKQRKRLEKRLTKAGKRLLAMFVQSMSEYQRRRFSKPILEATSVLPKEELAAMAEALVNLTSFKRKIFLDAETVGGPTDVAIISKGDGFVWIKRKHYFKPELNPGFAHNYYSDLSSRRRAK